MARSTDDIYSLINYKELEQLKKTLADKEEIIDRMWKRNNEGEKGYNKQSLNLGTIVKSIKFNYTGGKSSEVYTIETIVPDNMNPAKVKNYFKNRTVKEVFPELDEPERYMISAAYLKKENCWTVEVIKIK